MHLLIVGNNTKIPPLLSQYSITQTASGLDVVDRIKKETFDLVVLQSQLPDTNGYSVCRTLRDYGCLLPILMITSSRIANSRVRGLLSGADDCVDEPFSDLEFLARIHALIRRRIWNRSIRSYRWGGVEVNFRTGRVSRSGKRLQLSEREYTLLRYLVEAGGRVVSRDQLLLNVWGYTFPPRTRTVDMHIASLRQKLEKDPRNPQLILTVHSQGYRIPG